VSRDLAHQTAQLSVFLDPSGRRWRRIKLLVVIVLGLVVGGGLWVVPRLNAPPALQRWHPTVLSPAQTGRHPPVVGSGPLVRVARVASAGRRLEVIDPFTRAPAGVLSPTDAGRARRAIAAGKPPYVIQRFGYSATARRTISRTFDDGPDPRFTPKLLDLLARYHVPATFFVIGKMAAKYPHLVRREVREGHAVGNHSLTHADLSTTPAWRAREELVVTDHELRAITGRYASYVRLPYEGDDEASAQATLSAVLAAQRWGYLVVSHDFDTEDWQHDEHPNGPPIPLPPLDGRNLTLLMHDGGGSGRQRTIDYVASLIPAARQAGYVFQTMPQVQPWMRAASGKVTPSLSDRVDLVLVRAVYVWPGVALRTLFLYAIVAVVVAGMVNACLAVWRRRRARRAVLSDARQPSVSALIAAYNEEAVIDRTIRRLLASTCPIAEVVVVDDGSTDGTADIVAEVAESEPRVRLVRQANAGKWSALNNGLAQVTGEIVVTLDADTVFHPDTVTHLVRPFAREGTENLAAVAGTIRVGNRRRNLLTRWQALEYLTQIGVERAAQDVLGAIMVVPGACAAWRRSAVLAVGGYSEATLAEDADLTLALQEAGYRITQADDAVADTEAPEDVDALLAQRTRWTFGTLQSIFRHRRMLLRPRYGWLGLVVLPMYAISVLLPIVVIPFATAMAVLTVMTQGWGVVLFYFALFMAANIAVTAVGVRLMRERFTHLLMVPIYRAVYEPLRAYLLYSSASIAIKGARMGWKKLRRTGRLDGPPDSGRRHGTRGPQPALATAHQGTGGYRTEGQQCQPR
jgi:cellulose synthase/poly-beta-1,6-N-acetylglucosamine synthase-like glycosyltransferase/peptidoglycan/xylan/chitin deacetylase (PgdA/CDA1 family)